VKHATCNIYTGAVTELTPPEQSQAAINNISLNLILRYKTAES